MPIQYNSGFRKPRASRVVTFLGAGTCWPLVYNLRWNDASLCHPPPMCVDALIYSLMTTAAFA